MHKAIMGRLNFIIFLLIVLSIYFLIHLFVFLRLYRGLALVPAYRTALLIIFILGGAAFFVDRLITRRMLPDPFAFAVFQSGAVWLGVISIAFTLFLLQFILLFFLPRHSRVITVAALLLVFLVSSFSLYRGTRLPRTRDVEIPLQGLSPALSGFSIVQLSDLHLHRWTPGRWLDGVVERVNALGPDLIVITGDLIEDDINECGRFIDILRRLRAREGVVAITGNHEFYTGIENFHELCRRANITVLRNEMITIEQGIDIVGLDDPAGEMFPESRPDLESILGKSERTRPVVLLFHRPLHFEEAARMGVDLQLSGHTHAGQIPPMDCIVFLTYRYPFGLYRHHSAYLYTTCGTGIWGPPMRLFSRSEIVRIVLTSHSP
ncbi:MAG: metallophosphoesterase [bacterium]